MSRWRKSTHSREAFFAGQTSFQLQAYPFRMTPLNMARHRNSPNMAFWDMIKQGYDRFEVTHLEPRVEACEKRYVFDPETTDTFRPADRCPAYSVPEHIAAAIREKQRRDDVEIADLINRGIPPAPTTTGVDGVVNPALLAAAKWHGDAGAPRGLRFNERHAALGRRRGAAFERSIGGGTGRSDLGGRGRLAAGSLHEPHRLLDQATIGLAHAPRAILQPDADMAAARDGRSNQRPDIEAEAGDHPGSARVQLVEQVEVSFEIAGLRRKSETELRGEHEAIDRHRHSRHGRGGCGTESCAACFVDRVARPHAILGGNSHAFEKMIVGIEVGVACLATRDLIETREHRRAGIDHRPFEQAVLREPLDMRVALTRAAQSAGLVRACDRQGRINDRIHLSTNAFDDRRVNLVRVVLASRRHVIGMQMNDRGTGSGRGNPVGDDLFDGDWNGGLAVAPPGAIQRGFDPNLRDIVAHTTSLPRSRTIFPRLLALSKRDRKRGA